jgi:SAM-dependent methyltransferase
MITEARRRPADLGLPITFEVGDAHQVAFPDNTFNLCRTKGVLRYVDRPEAALGEMVRLTRPGGSVLVFNFDSDLTVVDAPDPVLARRIAELLDAAVPPPLDWPPALRAIPEGWPTRRTSRPPRPLPLPSGRFTICQQLSRGTIDRAMQAGQVTASEVAGWSAALARHCRGGDVLRGRSRIHRRWLQAIATGRT